MLRIIFALVLYCTATIGFAQRQINYDDIDVYLHTIDVGTELAEKYGHLQIRIRHKNGGDSTYSWGLYSFDSGFIFKFIRGILNYKIGSFASGDAERFYDFDGRTVWEDKINLTAAQKRTLIQNINTQLLPQNRTYSYLFFQDNCSTRPRDLINAALQGKFEESLKGKLSPWSYRETVRTHMATTPLSGLALEIMMNSMLDRPMTQWEEMYLPKSLRKYLLEMPQIDDQGEAILGTKLLAPKGTLVESPTPVANYWRDYYLMWGVLAILLGALIWLYRSPNPSKWVLFVWSDIIAGWGLIGFVFGFFMFFSTFFSQIKELQHSANLWILWPTDIVYLIWGLVGMKKRQLPAPGRSTKFIVRYTQAHMASFALLILLSLVGVIRQDVWRVVMTVGLCALVVHVGILRLCSKRRTIK